MLFFIQNQYNFIAIYSKLSMGMHFLVHDYVIIQNIHSNCSLAGYAIYGERERLHRFTWHFWCYVNEHSIYAHLHKIWMPQWCFIASGFPTSFIHSNVKFLKLILSKITNNLSLSHPPAFRFFSDHVCHCTSLRRCNNVYIRCLVLIELHTANAEKL